MTEEKREELRHARNTTLIIAGAILGVVFLIVQGCNYQADTLRDIYLETGDTPRVQSDGKVLPPKR